MGGIHMEGYGGIEAEVTAARELLVSVGEDNMVRTVNAYGEPFEVGNNGRVRISPENHVLQDLFSGSALNTNLWAPSTSTMTQSVGSGILTMNSGSSLTANAYSIINSIIQPPFWSDFSSYVHFRLKATPQTNTTMEFGWGVVATNTSPTDGVFFRINGAGVMSVVICFGGTETVSTATAAIDSTKSYEVQLEIINDHIKWYVADSSGATYFTDSGDALDAAPMYLPASQIKTVQLSTTQQMPVFARLYNGATPPVAAAQLVIGHANYIQRDMTRLKDWPTTMASMGRGLYQGPSTASLVQTANHANSTSPSSASLSNTVPGYTTLGGRYQFAAPASVTTDYLLFAYQVPTGFQAVITGISITAMNTGATVATTPTILDWALAVDSSAASLATTESPPTSWAPRRLPLGMQGFVVGALAGTSANEITRDFATPLVCNSGRFIQVIVQVPTGTATGSQVIRGDVTFHGYFE